MILLEYIIAQIQIEAISVAVNSRKLKSQNPALRIHLTPSLVEWQLIGLNIGGVERIDGESRVNRIDFYIGMDDLVEQRQNFPKSRGVSLGSPDGLRNPLGTERSGGKSLKWKKSFGRISVNQLTAVIPPFKVSNPSEGNLVFNIDGENSPYPINSENGNKTIRELHFGVEGDFKVVQDNRVSTPRIKIMFTHDEYASILEFIDNAIFQHN